MVKTVGLVTQWRGQPDTSDRRVRWLLLLSLLVHAPLTPLVALLGVLGMLARPAEPLPDEPPITAIPVDLIEDQAPGPPDPPAPAATETGTELSPVAVLPRPAPSAKAPEEPKKELPDAGAPDAGAAVDAGLADAGAPSDAGAAASSDAGLDGGGGPDGGVDGGLGEPVAVTGDAKKVVDAEANVRVVVYTEKIRALPLGARVGRLLGSVYQWRDFFGPAALDPIRDVDRLLLVGPQFRDSSNVVAVLKVNVSKKRLLAAIDAIVKADTEHGKWLDAGIPAAHAFADRAPRVFVLPAPGIVVVTPPSAEKAALSLGKKTGIAPAKGDEIASAYAVTPWRLARGLPLLDVPKSLRWARARLTPTEGGGALVDLEAEDETPELAIEHARAFARQLMTQDLRLWALGFPSQRLVSRADLSADGARIVGTLTLSPGHIDALLALGEAFLVEPRRPRTPADAGSPSASPSALPR